jgi:hypothetical protein
MVADNTAEPNGTMMTVAERLREKLERHGPDSPNASERNDYIRAAARRVADRLAAVTRRWSERQVSRRVYGPGLVREYRLVLAEIAGLDIPGP